MASVKTIRVQYFRTHHRFQAAISPHVTVIIGPNGAGKTSLVEALYIALQGASFKGTDKDIMQQGASWYRVDVDFADETKRSVKFDSALTTGRKQFVIDGKTSYRLGVAQKYPVVLFEPDDLRLLSGSPARRRQFVDRSLSQLDPHYTAALRRYERALKQRNALLKQPSPRQDDLFVWDVALSEHGAYMIEKRRDFLHQLDTLLTETYRVIAKTSDTIKVRYSAPAHKNTQQWLMTELHAHAKKDIIQGFTSVGPHRDDMLVDFNGVSVASVVSRGEMRSIILALKFLEARTLERVLVKKPIILLDDVFSELDEVRQKNLMTEFTGHQIIITSVKTVPIKSSLVVSLITAPEEGLTLL